MTPAALWTTAVVTAAAVLSFDLLLPLGVAGGVPYVALVLLALRTPSRNSALTLAAAGSVLTALGFLLSEPSATLWVVLTNRALAIFVIWLSVLPVVRYQRIRFGGLPDLVQVEDVMNGVQEAVIISDERATILAANKSAEAMFGCKGRELVGQSAAILRPEPERTQHQKQIDEFNRTGRKVFVGKGMHAETGQRKDGSTFPMEMQVGEFWRNGQRLFVGTIRDISARVEAEDAHRQTKELFEKAFHASPLLTSLTRMSDGQIVDANEKWLSTLAYARKKVIGVTSTDLDVWVDPEQREEAYETVRTLGHLSDSEAIWRTKDGRHIDVVLSAERLDLSGGPAILTIAKDQTEHKAAQLALRESEERFAKAFHGAPLMMCILRRRDFLYLDLNDAWMDGLGYERDEVVGQTSAEFSLWVHDWQREEAHKLIRDSGAAQGLEAQWRRADGEVIDVRMQSAQLDVDGEPAVLSTARDITEENRAEQALRQSEARFRDVAEISSDWIWETDARNRVIFISERVRELLGVAPEDIVGGIRGTHERVVDQDSEEWKEHLKQVEARHPFQNFVYQHYDGEGGIRHIQISGKPVFEADGEFIGYRGVGSDITERREIELARGLAEQEREQAHQRLQAVLDNVLEGIVTIDEQGVIESINPAGLDLFDYMENDLLGRNVSILMASDEAETHDGYLSKYRSTGNHNILGKPRELCARRRDGSEFPIELRVSEMDLRDGRKFVGAIRDLTARKNAEIAQRRSEEHLRAVIENSSDVISIVSADGTIRFESPALERISGFSRDELKGRHIALLAHEDDREKVRDAFARLIDTPGAMETVEYRARHKDGSWLTIESIANNMLDNAVVNGVVVTSRDITERKRALDALRRAKEEAEYANRGKTEFLANMSHELRTPLNAVIGFAGMIENEVYGPLGSHKYKESANHIDESATHLLSLINDLLDVSKIEVGKMDMSEEVFDVGPTIDQMLRIIGPRAEQAGVIVEGGRFSDLPQLFADPRMLKQIVLNLVSNAVKFTPEGGSVVVRTKIEHNGGLAITVTDTGMGMAPEDIPTALAAFGQIKTDGESNAEGTGLGLPLSKSLIEMHGGTIEIDSTIDTGTTVTVRYPESRVRHTSADAKVEGAKAP